MQDATLKSNNRAPGLIPFVALVLSGCVAQGPTFPDLSMVQSGEPQSTDISGLSNVKQGMTLQAVSRLIGSAVASADDPDQIGHTCFAHPYVENGSAKFIHSIYLGGNLTGIETGFEGICGPQDFL